MTTHGPAYEFTNEEMLAKAVERELAGSLWANAQKWEIKDAMREGRQFAYKFPACVYCRELLFVPGAPCRGCGRPCRDSFVAPAVE